MSRCCSFVNALIKCATNKSVEETSQGSLVNPGTGAAAGFVLGLILNQDRAMKRGEWLKSQLLYTVAGAGTGALLEKRYPKKDKSEAEAEAEA